MTNSKINTGESTTKLTKVWFILSLLNSGVFWKWLAPLALPFFFFFLVFSPSIKCYWLNICTTFLCIYTSHDYNSLRRWHPTPVLLPGKSHGRRSLVGCSPWGREESDTTEWFHFHFSLSCIGEGNVNPLQCSCLENPRDEAAWWAAVYGVA